MNQFEYLKQVIELLEIYYEDLKVKLEPFRELLTILLVAALVFLLTYSFCQKEQEEEKGQKQVQESQSSCSIPLLFAQYLQAFNETYYGGELLRRANIG